MISKSAVKNFLARELDSMDWLKSASPEILDTAISHLDSRPDFHTNPWNHQKVCFLIGTVLPNFLYFAEMGVGKTKIILDLLSFRLKTKECTSALILVPNLANIDGWMEDVKIHAPHLKAVPLYGSTDERKFLLNQDADLFIVNYQGLLYLTTKAGKKKRLLDEEQIELFQNKFDFLVADESHKLKSHNTTIYKIVRNISGGYKFRYALTGTPFGRDPHDLWSQFYIVDRGETLGPTLGIFREAFFSSKKNYWGGYEYTFKSAMEDKLHEVIQNRSIYYGAEECQDLPEKVYRQIPLKFPIDTYKYYKNEIKTIINAKGNVEEMQNAFMNMRQISSGFVTLKTGNEKIIVDFGENPKLDALVDLIEGIPKNRKIIIFNEFIHSGDLICEALKKLKIKHERLYSKTKDVRKAVRNFKEKKDCQVLVANSASGSTGLNLQVANYVIFYECPVSPQTRQQAEKRCHRAGQKSKKVFYYDLAMENSIDGKILQFIKEGKDLFEALIEGKEIIDG